MIKINNKQLEKMNPLPYGFIYLTRNKVNGKKYIGKKVLDKKGKWKSYLGSGVILKKAVEKYGRDSFNRKILDVAYSNTELCEKEKYYIKINNAQESDKFYNIAEGGEGYNAMNILKSHVVLCLEERRFYANATVASRYTGENESTISSKCQRYHKEKSLNLKKGKHFVFIEDAYKFFNQKINSKGRPVVFLKDNKVYGSCNSANILNNMHIDRKTILNYHLYIKWTRLNKDISNKLIFLKDYLYFNDYVDMNNY